MRRFRTRLCDLIKGKPVIRLSALPLYSVNWVALPAYPTSISKLLVNHQSLLAHISGAYFSTSPASYEDRMSVVRQHVRLKEVNHLLSGFC